MKLHHLCCITTSTFILPIIYYRCINICNILIMTSIVCSLLFWRNPVRHNIYHKIDGLVAKLTYGYVLSNTIIKLRHTPYLYEYCSINVFVILLFLISNYYSKNWCSVFHIFFIHCFI